MDERPQFVATCVKCQTHHDIGILNNWGGHPGTQGLGPRPVCSALVPNARATGNEVCRGMLVASPAG